MDPAYTETPFRSYRIPRPKTSHRTVEEDIPGPFQLSRPLHARNLSVRDIPVIIAPDVGKGGWVRTFHSVVH